MFSDSVLELLEFPKVLDYVAKYASTELGKERVLKLRSLDNLEAIVENGKFVKEAGEILIEKDYPPISYLPDLKNILFKSRIENAILRAEEIQNILSLAESSRRIYSFFKTVEANSPALKSFAEKLIVDKVFEHQIKKIFTESGDVADSASKELRRIRNEIREKSERLRITVEKILRRLSDTYLVQDEYITQRDGRIVLPIKVEHKRHVKGFIHSESATGQTVYIEPEETLELNNEILSLKFAEKREVERILKSLTKIIGEKSGALLDSLEIISFLDEQFAKAKYSVEIIGAFPQVTDSAREELIEARHPILLKKLGRERTVPLNIKVENEQIIIITGPNAGGKTVVLKTFGLLHLMVYAGIPIPAHPDSSIRLYEKILIDIGDKQSIEDDLSTFSSHLSNISNILKVADSKSLILLDEIGTGTDPTEGAALASAVLLKLKEKGSLTLATTHHGNLKVLANETEGFQNASMEFNVETISPSYRFKQGLPGSSYAFEVAEKIGLEKEILNSAKEHLGTDKQKLEDFLVEIEKKSDSLRRRLNQLEIENSRLAGLSNLYKEKLQKLEKSKNRILDETKAKAETYLNKMNKEFEATIKEIRESNASRESIKKGKEKLEEFKKEKDISSKTKKNLKKEKAGEFRRGDFVALKNSQTVGEVISIDNEKKRAVILVGSLKLQVKISDLTEAEKPRKVERKSPEIFDRIVKGVQATRLDIRGRKPEEVEYEIVKFIDDAYAANVNKIEILHGKGTGVLKRAVHEILDSHQAVRNYYFAKIEYGGEGITIVELK
jgi:DNA mismatch repair protein MutS2